MHDEHTHSVAMFGRLARLVCRLNIPSVFKRVFFIFPSFTLKMRENLIFFRLITLVLANLSLSFYISIFFRCLLTFILAVLNGRMGSLVVNILVCQMCYAARVCVCERIVRVCVFVQYIKLSARITASTISSCCDCCCYCCCCCCCLSIYICVLFLLQWNTCLAHVWVHVSAFVYICACSVPFKSNLIESPSA